MARALLIVIFGVIVISCVVTPALFVLLGQLYPEFPWPYSRVFDRVILLVAILMLVWQRKNLSLPDFKSLFGNRTRRWLFIAVGFVVSAGGALSVLPLVIRPEHGLTWSRAVEAGVWFERVGKVLLTAVVVSLLEELIFRGALYQSVRKKLPELAAAASVSFGYAIVHFLAPNKEFAVTTANPIVGFEYFGTLLMRLLEPGIVTGIFGLWLVGMVLCEAVKRTGGLFLSLGLHAGWIFAAKASMYLTTELPGAVFPSGVGRRYFLVTMPEVWATILAAWVLVILVGPRLAGRVDSADSSALP